MTIDEAREICLTIRSSEFEFLVDDLIRCAVRYAQLRVEWELSTLEERITKDAERNRAHDAFIDAMMVLINYTQEKGDMGKHPTM